MVKTIAFWVALPLMLGLLYQAWREWRRAGRSRMLGTLLFVAVLLSGLMLDGAPAAVRYTQTTLVLVVSLALLWRERKAVFTHNAVTWLGGIVIALIVILEIDHDFYPFLSHTMQRVLLLVFAATGVAFLVVPIVQMTKLTMEARQVIADARKMVKDAAPRP